MRRDEVSVDVVADTTQFDAAMKALNTSTREFGRVFSSAISSSIKSGRGFEDILKNLGRRLSDLALNKALKPLENLFGNILNGVAGGISGQTDAGQIPGFASGAAFPANGIKPFANGGVVSSATLFNFGSQLGVMGEKGPEAIMPLKRGKDGKLGVAASESGTNGMNIVFNVQATDVASFRKSEAQISTMLTRAVSRGRRGI